MLIYIVNYRNLVIVAFKTRPQAIEWIKSRSLLAKELTEDHYGIIEVELQEENNVSDQK